MTVGSGDHLSSDDDPPYKKSLHSLITTQPISPEPWDTYKKYIDSFIAAFKVDEYKVDLYRDYVEMVGGRERGEP